MVWLLIVLAACGQVVSVETPTPLPTAVATTDDQLSTIPVRPTVTQAFPTSPPPNTPTPSPTPIIHVVQPGETLIAIALQYGVTVEALQSVNGISDPSTLQVSQELFVPTGEGSLSNSGDLLLSTPTPVAFAIEGLNCREEPVGSLWCLGDAVNSTGASIENAQVRVSLYDAAGAELTSGEVFVALGLIPPGQRAPFGVLFPSPPQDFERFAATPVRAETSNEPASRYAVLEPTATQAGPAGLLFQVEGSVTNHGQRLVTSILIVVTTYDKDGQVTGFRQSRLADDLSAGASVDFTTSLMPHGGVPASYTLAVQGQLASP